MTVLLWLSMLALEQTNASTEVQNCPKAREIACTLILMSKDRLWN